MRHAPDGVLRRLEDEPFAVPDSTFEHVSQCGRCRTRRDAIATDARRAAGLLAGPQLVPDVDRGWSDLARRMQASRLGPAPAGHAPRPPRRAVRMSVRGGLIAGTAAVVLGGTAAAASLTNVFSPTHVASVPVNAADVQALAGFMNLGDPSTVAGFPTPTGTGTLPFGSLRWDASAPAQQVGSAASAEALSGIPVSLPARLPAGVGSPKSFVVQPRVSATLTFNSAAGKLAGTTVGLNAGPAVFVVYGSRSNAADVPTLGILIMRRPTATSTGASISQIESYLLSRPGIPSQLAEEIRLLGDISSVLPVPTPSGLGSKQVQVAGNPGVVITDGSGAASGVVWEDRAGIVHAVAGLINQQNVLDVANQLG